MSVAKTRKQYTQKNKSSINFVEREIKQRYSTLNLILQDRS